jgi:hypothetical protein
LCAQELKEVKGWKTCGVLIDKLQAFHKARLILVWNKSECEE